MVIEEITGRIARDLEHLKQFTATPGNGCTRLPFTKEARKAVEYLKELMTESGLSERLRGYGNRLASVGTRLVLPDFVGGDRKSVV